MYMQVKEQEEVSTPKKGKKRGPSRGIFSETTKAELRASAGGFFTTMETLYNMAPVKLVRLAVVVWLGYTSRKYAASFSEYCNQLAHGMSNPSLVFKAHLNNGQVQKIYVKKKKSTNACKETLNYSEVKKSSDTLVV